MMTRSISQTTAAISQITTAITTTVMIKLNAPRTLLTSSQLGPGHPEGYLCQVCTLYALASLRAAAARHTLVLDDLAIKVVLGLDNAAKEHPAVHAGVGALQAGVVRLYGVVLILSGCMRIG